jgi:hypothetical protein
LFSRRKELSEIRIVVMRRLLNAVYRCTTLFAVATAFLLLETASFAANNNSVTYDITQGAGGTTWVTGPSSEV